MYVGPAGYAALGQFQNAVQMLTTLASGAINSGVTKYTAEYYEDEAKQHAVWRTACTLALIGSLVVSIGVFSFRRPLASWFLKDESLSGVFIWFAATLVFFIFNTLLLAILNGKKDIQRYVVANITGSLFALAITAVMTIQLGLYGALVALAIYQSLAFFVTLMLCYKTSWFSFIYLLGGIDKQAAKGLAKFAGMALASAICVPISHIIIRDYLGEVLGWEAAGYWEAIWRLSAAYLLLVTTTLSVYYLPRLSEIKNPDELKAEIIQGYKIILPIAATLGVMIYLLRDYIIGILFTVEFMPMRDLFAWQLAGDTLKVGSWVVAYLMISKAMLKSYIFLEVFSSVSFVILAKIFIAHYGIDGVVIAYAVNYAFYWMLTLLAVRDKLFVRGC